MAENIVTYPAIVTTAAGHTRVHFPDLPAADVADDDYEHALLRARVGLAIIIIDLESHFEPVPAPTPVADLKPATGTVKMITTDLDQY